MSENQALLEEIAQLEQAVMEKQQRLNQLRKQLAGREAVADYTLRGPDNRPVNLSNLFGDKQDLIVIHNMGSSCTYCTLWADGFNGQIDHLENRAAFVVVSPDTPEVQAKFAASRGWRFAMASGQGSTFIEDMGFKEGDLWMPGASTFSKAPDGSMVRVGKTFFGPGDTYCAVWHFFDLLDDGVNEWQPAFEY